MWAQTHYFVVFHDFNEFNLPSYFEVWGAMRIHHIYPCSLHMPTRCFWKGWAQEEPAFALKFASFFPKIWLRDRFYSNFGGVATPFPPPACTPMALWTMEVCSKVCLIWRVGILVCKDTCADLLLRLVIETMFWRKGIWKKQDPLNPYPTIAESLPIIAETSLIIAT